MPLKEYKSLWVSKKKKFVKGALSGQRQFLTTESPLKMMKIQ